MIDNLLPKAFRLKGMVAAIAFLSLLEDRWLARPGGCEVRTYNHDRKKKKRWRLYSYGEEAARTINGK